MGKLFRLMLLILSLNASAGFAQDKDSTYTSLRTQQLKEVVVTGQFLPGSTKRSIYQVRTIDERRIRATAATSLQQVLNTQLGFRFSNDLTLGTTDVELMGMNGRNVTILLDGVAMPDRGDSRESLMQIDVNSVERIEIIEGPVSVTYGSDALAGVINIITKKNGGKKLSMTAKLQEESIGGDYSPLSGKGTHQQHFSISGIAAKNWSTNLSISRNEFAGWNLLPKTATISEVNSQSNRWKPKSQFFANSKFGFINNKFSIWYRFDALKENIDSRGGMNPNNFKAEFQTFTTHRFTQQLQADWKPNDKLQLLTVIGFTNLNRRTNTAIYDFTTGLTTLSEEPGKQDLAKFNALTVRTTGTVILSEIFSIQPGISISRDAAFGARIKGTPVISDYAFFASSEIKPLKSLILRPGARFIKNTVYSAPAVIPSFNAKLDLSSSLDLRAAYAQGFRAPALRELYFDFVDASHMILGNENLKAETSDSFNASMTWEVNKDNIWKQKVSLSSFFNLFKNRIEYGVDPKNSTITTLFNVSKFKTKGITLDYQTEFKGITAGLGLAHIGRWNMLSEEGTGLNLPDFVWSEEINANLTYPITRLNLSLNAFYKWAGARPNYQLLSNNGNKTAILTQISGFHWADLSMMKRFSTALDVSLGIKNLFDVTQLANSSLQTGATHQNGGTSVPYSYGRSFFLALTYQWNKN